MPRLRRVTSRGTHQPTTAPSLFPAPLHASISSVSNATTRATEPRAWTHANSFTCTWNSCLATSSITCTSAIRDEASSANVHDTVGFQLPPHVGLFLSFRRPRVRLESASQRTTAMERVRHELDTRSTSPLLRVRGRTKVAKGRLKRRSTRGRRWSEGKRTNKRVRNEK